MEGAIKDRLAKLDVDSEKLPVDERAAYWQRMGTAYRHLGDTKHAGEYWLKVAAISPNDQKIGNQLFDMCRDMGDVATMSKLLEFQRQRLGKNDARRGSVRRSR